MYTEVLEHDIQSGIAKIRFSHNRVTHTQTYDLGLVVPGTRRALAEAGSELTPEIQDRVIEKLSAQVQRDIEAGIIQNPI
jgi:hypothetical protein